ncbi:MAG: hypothetical protein LAO23_13030 [Acidobacteriia bacterium]|nr:hypothetical protein [Terriglobia bacterium]
MIECIFTIDYEIYGDGTGALMELVHVPAKRLQEIFEKWNARFVNFVEVAEFEKIDAVATDPAIGFVKRQIRDLYESGFEIGLHLHPQWCNARRAQGRWILDATEYNLCTLPRKRIVEIVEGSLGYLRRVLDQPDFSPLSFRAGNWLFQPTHTAASVLSEYGIKIDSSVFKGGLQRNHKLDYRPALKNGYYWPFSDNANEPDPSGAWIEVPIHTEMVPTWQMTTSKRMSFSGNVGMGGQGLKRKVNRALDFLRFRYPRKFDFCRMTLAELTSMIDRVVCEDRKSPEVYRPLVAIGHTKDLRDFRSVDAFLAFLRTKGITVCTFSDIYSKLAQPQACVSVPAGSEANVGRE